MKSFILPAILLLIVILSSSCMNNQDKETIAKQNKIIDSLNNLIAQQSGPTIQQAQDMYSMEFLNMLNIVNEIRAGGSEKLTARIENSIPDYLSQMADFNNSPLKTVSFYLANKLYTTEHKTIPENLTSYMEMALKAGPPLLSDSCYEDMQCNAPGCVPWPTSLRAVDITKPNPMGWRYIVGSHCGFSWPKFWNLDCGQPVTGQACTGS